MNEIKPWSLKGVSPEARNAAIAAAARDKMPVGQWVARACLEAAQGSARESRALVVQAPPDPDVLAKCAAAAEALGRIDPAGPARLFVRDAYKALRKTLKGQP